MKALEILNDRNAYSALQTSCDQQEIYAIVLSIVDSIESDIAKELYETKALASISKLISIVVKNLMFYNGDETIK